MDEPVDVNAVFDDVKDFLADEAFLVFLQKLLDKKERKKLISEAIESAGLSKSKATLLAVPVDWIFIQCVNRAVKTGGGAVQSRLLKFYDSLLRTPACARLATFLSKQLFVELHTKYRTQTTINALLSANTLTLSLRDEDKRWVDVLEKLNLLTLQLQGLEARCTLRSQNLSAPEIDKPSTLLMPDSRFIKQLVGRDREQTELQGFAMSEAPFLYGVISGEGGSGKTRLALSLCDAMQEEGWTSGFLTSDDLEALVSHPCFDLWTPPPNTLIVIDYAQSKSGKGGALTKLLQRLLILAEEESLHAVRLLLLEREAERESGWLFDLYINLEAPQRVAAQSLFYHHWQLDSDTEQSPEEKSIFTQALLQGTLNAYSELQHVSPRALPAWEESEWLQLAEQTGLRPLCLIIAGLQYAETGDERTLLSANLKTLLLYVVEKERRHIELCAADSIISSQHLSLAVAFLTLIGSQSEESDDCRQAVHHCAQAIGCDAVSLKEGLRKVCSRVVEDEYGDRTHRLIPVGPDLIAGPFIFQILGIDASQRRKILSAAVERNP
ncbi:MAG: hypothetical protein C0620_07655 [Desulfuromonas sp.]|nr:MAG: hypothetical protein C0620_07655 [Desulfuromonas sp.]